MGVKEAVIIRAHAGVHSRVARLRWVRSSAFCVFLVSLSSVLSGAGDAQAQSRSDLRWDDYDYGEMSLEELLNAPLTSSGFFVTDISKSTQKAQVFTRELLDRDGVVSLGDLLQSHAAGINLGTHPNFGDLIGTRGIMVDNNAKTLLLEDNVNVNFRTHWGVTGTRLRDTLLGSVDAVEVVLGPGAIQHGSGAINGSINVRTATGRSREGLWSRLGAGTGQLGLGEVSYGHVFEGPRKQDLYLYAGYAYSEGDAAKRPEGIADTPFGGLVRVNGTEAPNYKLLTKYRVATLGERVVFDVKAQYHQLTNSTNSYPRGITDIGQFNRHNYGSLGQGYIETRRLLLVPEVELRLAPKHTLTLTPSAQFMEARGRNTQRFAAAVSAYTADQLAQGLPDPGFVSTGTAEEQFTARLVYRTEAISQHQLAAGLTVGRKYFTSARAVLGIKDWGHSLEGPERFSWNEFGVFAEDVWTPGKLSLSAGLRYELADFGEYRTGPEYGDVATDFAGVQNLVGRIAGAYEFSDNASGWLSVQQGFRFPDAAYYLDLLLLNQVYAGLVPAIPSLKPEHNEVVELGYRHLLARKTVELTGTVSYGRYRDLLGWVDWSRRYPTEAATLEASPDYRGYWSSFGNSESVVQSLSAEFGVNYRPTTALDVSGSYSYSRPLGRADSNFQLASWDNRNWFQFPTHMVKAAVSYSLGRFRLSLVPYFRTGADSQGTEANPIRDNALLPINERARARPSFTLDTALSYKPADNATFALIVKNVTRNDVQPLAVTNTLFYGNVVSGLVQGRLTLTVTY